MLVTMSERPELRFEHARKVLRRGKAPAVQGGPGENRSPLRAHPVRVLLDRVPEQLNDRKAILNAQTARATGPCAVMGVRLSFRYPMM